MSNIEKKYSTLRVVMVINVIAVIACILGCIYGFILSAGIYNKIAIFLEIIALIASVAYFSGGFKKDAAKFYKVFMLFNAFTYIAEFALLFLDDAPITLNGDVLSSVALALSLILYGNTLLLGVAKDLGKKVSYIICIINLVFYTVSGVLAFIPEAVQYANVQEQIVGGIMSITWFVIAVIMLVMTVAKYTDKAIRKGE